MGKMMEKNLRWLVKGTGVALLAAVLTLGGCASGGPSTMLTGIEQKIESASSRQDHEAIALQYEQEAAANLAAVKRHQAYAATYRRSPPIRNRAQAYAAMANHCDKLARTYQQAADDNLAMAKMHREMGG